MNKITEAYSEYVGTVDGFNKFHIEVFNMPRDSFSDAGYKKVKDIAGYLLLLENKLDNRFVNYKQTMELIRNQLLIGNYPANRNSDLEDRYFIFDDLHINYEENGRMFRHLMGLASYFGFVVSESRQKKFFNFDKCREFALSDEETFIPIARNNLINLNARTNDYINSLSGIDIRNTTDYRPTYAILNYLYQIDRPATNFEISILLGRIDKLDTEKEIIDRALSIGSILPKDFIGQRKYFFDAMNWKSNNQYFKYKSSQEPYFKFNSYLLYMVEFGLLDYDIVNELYTLSDYSLELLRDDISPFIADLEVLLERVDDYDATEGALSEVILVQRNPDFVEFIKEDEAFIYKMNKRSIEKVQYHANGQRKRNKLIAELAKILANYKCEYKDDHVFIKEDGRYYVEAHHIIHFNEEGGPDITENLVALGPEPHTAIHQGAKEVADDVYLQLVKNNSLNYERFERMVVDYNVLEERHISLLFDKNILSSRERDRLLETYYEYQS